VHLAALISDAWLFDIHNIHAHQSQQICGERTGNHLGTINHTQTFKGSHCPSTYPQRGSRNQADRQIYDFT
jgi:hypothetical protein